jgi:hypothetical protein
VHWEIKGLFQAFGYRCSMTLIGYSFGMDVWIGDVGLWRWRGMEQMMGMGLVIDGGSWLLWGG